MFYNEVLCYLPSIDEFRFIQSDNGQLNTKKLNDGLKGINILSFLTSIIISLTALSRELACELMFKQEAC